MSRNDNFNQWLKKVAMFVALIIVFGLPAIYWVSTTFLGVDARSAVDRTFKRVFSRGFTETLQSMPDDGSD